MVKSRTVKRERDWLVLFGLECGREAEKERKRKSNVSRDMRYIL